MRKTIKFLTEVSKLKKIQRTGWIWRGIKNPETIAQHSFRLAFMSWVLARNSGRDFDLEKIIKISLVHDLCEVYLGDVTPYWGLVPEDVKKRRAVLKKWIRLPKKEKERRKKEKFAKEKKALKRLIKPLSPKLQRDIFNRWLEYEDPKSAEGRFVKQVDKIETLLQALEYWGAKPKSYVGAWWEEVEDLVDEPKLLDFLKGIENKFYHKKKASGNLAFFLELGKLKNKTRKSRLLRGLKNSGTVAEECFMLAMAVWVLAPKKLNLEKMMKMALVYQICELYIGEKTFLDKLFPQIRRKKEKEWTRVIKKWPIFPKKDKKRFFKKDYKKEEKSVKKICRHCNDSLKRKIISLWKKCKSRATPEGNFVNQAYWVMTMFQVLECWKENKKTPLSLWLKQMAVYIDDPIILNFLETLYKINFKNNKKIL